MPAQCAGRQQTGAGASAGEVVSVLRQQADVAPGVMPQRAITTRGTTSPSVPCEFGLSIGRGRHASIASVARCPDTLGISCGRKNSTHQRVALMQGMRWTCEGFAVALVSASQVDCRGSAHGTNGFATPQNAEGNNGAECWRALMSVQKLWTDSGLWPYLLVSPGDRVTVPANGLHLMAGCVPADDRCLHQGEVCRCRVNSRSAFRKRFSQSLIHKADHVGA